MPERSTNRLSCVVAEDSNSGAFVKSGSTSGLNWRDKLRNWTRWTSAVPKTLNVEKKSKDLSILVSELPNDSQQNNSPSFPITLKGKKRVGLPRSFIFPKDINQVKGGSFNSGNSPWVLRRFTVSSVLLGNLLHDGPGTKDMVMQPAEACLDAGDAHTFCPTIPNLSRVLRSAGRIQSQTIQSIIMRFQPSPWRVDGHGKPIGYDALKAFPPVHMRFSADPSTQEMELKDVIATVSTDSSDLMLPDQPVDLRFLQETTCRLRSPDRLQAIQEFVEKSRITDGQPKTPPKIVLPIDKQLCNQSVIPDLLGKADSPTIDVEYLYTGHEYRNTMLMNWMGWLLVYTSIQTGEGGTSGELRLRARRTPMYNPPKDAKATQKSESQSYINAAFDLVNAVGEGNGVSSIIKVPTLVRFIHLPEEDQPLPRGYKFFVNRVDFSRTEGSEDCDPAGAKDEDVERHDGWSG